MARILLLVAAAGALALPATLSAAAQTDGTLSVKRGRGLVVLKFRGTAIGSVGTGLVRIRDLDTTDGQTPHFRHCRRLRRSIDGSTTVCSGRRLSFRALDGPFVVTTKGTGIFLSAVGQGTVLFDGAGDWFATNGVYSFDGGPYEPIPDDPTTYPLGTPSATP
jgi:hypothetical protein